MDLEAIPIQIQTPPKEDEMETPPPALVDLFVMDDDPEEYEQEEEEEEKKKEEEFELEKRDDEIVVEDAENDVDGQNGHQEHETSLSSAPSSDDEKETPKPGTHAILSCSSNFLKMSLSRFEIVQCQLIQKE